MRLETEGGLGRHHPGIGRIAPGVVEGALIARYEEDRLVESAGQCGVQIAFRRDLAIQPDRPDRRTRNRMGKNGIGGAGRGMISHECTGIDARIVDHFHLQQPAGPGSDQADIVSKEVGIEILAIAMAVRRDDLVVTDVERGLRHCVQLARHPSPIGPIFPPRRHQRNWRGNSRHAFHINRNQQSAHARSPAASRQ